MIIEEALMETLIFVMISFLGVCNFFGINYKGKILFWVLYSIESLFPVDEINNFKERLGFEGFFVVSLMTFGIFYLMIDLMRPLSKQNNFPSYSISIGTLDDAFTLQVGFYSFHRDFHPSLEGYEPVILSHDGEYSPTAYTQKVTRTLTAFLDLVDDHPHLQIQLVQMPWGNPIYPRFFLVIYSLIEMESGNVIDNAALNSIKTLDLEHYQFRRILFDKHLKSKFHKTARLNDVFREVYFQPEFFKHYSDHSFELAIHELDIFATLLEHFNTNKVKILPKSGDFYLGLDIHSNPIYMYNFDRILYLGSTRLIPQIMSFENINTTILLTDDDDLIAQMKKRHGFNISVLTKYDFGINVLGLLKTDPRLVRTIIQLWEDLLPDTFKTEYYKEKITPAIIEFLELHQLSYPDKSSLRLSDLMQSTTFLQFSEDLSLKASSKFQGIFDLPCFNIQGKQGSPHITGLSQDHSIIIDLRDFTYRQKKAIFAIIAILKSYLQLKDKWLMVSLITESNHFDDFLSKIIDYVDFHETIINLRSLGKVGSWMNVFDLYIAEAKNSDKELRDIFFKNYPNTQEGMFVNYQFRHKTILRENRELTFR